MIISWLWSGMSLSLYRLSVVLCSLMWLILALSRLRGFQGCLSLFYLWTMDTM